MITISAYNWVPDFAKGHVRDLRVRWALEEAGIPYEVRLIDHTGKLSADYRAWQPFGQVPAFEEDGVRMFESGAIVLHIAERSEVLMPADPAARARVLSWVIAALNSVEPFVMWLSNINLHNADAPWADAARQQALAMVKKRLDGVAHWLGSRDWLEDRFTAADLLMACVLRSLAKTGLVSGDPVLGPYLKRCLDRPAFGRALSAQMADFTGSPPANM